MGLGGKTLEWRGKGLRGNKSDCIGNRDFKVGRLEDLAGGCGLAKRKRGTSALRVAADTGRKKGLQERKQEGSQRLQKKGSLILLTEGVIQGPVPLELSQTVLPGVSRPRDILLS